MLSITRRFAVPALAILLAERRVEAQSPTPILRIEAGMHVAPIKGISVDESGRLAMTVSMDKTARLWDVPLPTRLAPAVDAIGGNASLEGRATLLRVLRPPIDQSGEGALLAGALSPDGSLAAVGGYTGQERPDGCWIYLFESSSGRLVRQFSGLPGAIKHIAFSKQGSFLAATLLGGGLVVWEVASGREIGRDVDYGDSDTFGVDWQGEERMVTTCDDGKLRLYELHKVGIDREVWYIKSASVRGGQVPFTARFSPDGRQIAVGFADSANVAVVDGHDLHFLFAPDTSGVTNGCLSSVTWVDEDATATGHGQLSLAAGGTWNMREDENGIRLWPAAGRGKPEDRAAALNVIQDLRSLPGGRILFGAQDPAWGEVDPESATDDLKSQWHGAPAAADFRGLARKFSLSRATGQP